MEFLKVLEEKLGEEIFTEEFQKEVEAQLEVIINEKVQSKVETLKEQLENEYEIKKQELEEEVKQEIVEYKAELDENIDGYLDYAVKEFFQENKIAIEDEFTVKAAKELIESFANIIENNHFTVNTDQKKVITKLEEKVSDLETKLNKAIRESIDKKMEIEEYKKSLKFKKLTEGLSKVKAEKVLSLTEGLEFKDMADFERKIKVCIEKVCQDKKVNNKEEIEELTEKTIVTKSDIDKYL